MKKQSAYTILFTILILFTHHATPKITPLTTIHDVSCVTTGTVKSIETPKSIDDLRQIVLNAQGPIAIAGGRFSQGGHIWCNNGTVIDMTHFNKITEFDIIKKKITVQAGITWRSLQNFIQQCGLSIKVMQSYNDFTVGGSLAVNVHGRDIAYGPFVDTVESCKVLLADGSLVTASRHKHYDLFQLVCGGYGAGGIITEITFSLTDNVPIECSTQPMALKDYKKFFFSEIYKNPQVALHNANLYPNEYKEVVAVTWHTSLKPLTNDTPLQKYKKVHVKEGIAGVLLRYIPWLNALDSPLKLQQNLSLLKTTRLFGEITK